MIPGADVKEKFSKELRFDWLMCLNELLKNEKEVILKNMEDFWN